jgi:hypothetical protein
MQERVSPVLDSTFGEVVRVKGMRQRANFPAERDPERPIVEAVAIFTDRAALWGGAAPDNIGKRRVPFQREQGGAPSPEVITSTPQFSFAYPAPLLKRGDLILRCEEGTVWSVTGVYPDKVARALVTVSEAGLASQADFS